MLLPMKSLNFLFVYLFETGLFCVALTVLNLPCRAGWPRSQRSVWDGRRMPPPPLQSLLLNYPLLIWCLQCLRPYGSCHCPRPHIILLLKGHKSQEASAQRQGSLLNMHGKKRQKGWHHSKAPRPRGRKSSHLLVTALVWMGITKN